MHRCPATHRGQVAHRGRSRTAAGSRTAGRAPRRHRDEAGTATAFVIGFAVVLMACAGLVIDGGNALNARMKLADDVEQAARVGANQIDLDALRAGDPVSIDPAAADAEARGYLAALGYSRAGVTATTDTVSVTAEDTVPTALLQLVGISTFDISASATAQAATE